MDLIYVNTLDPAQSAWEHAGAQGRPLPGLQAQYFSSNNLSGSPVSRTGAHVDFQWDGGSIPAGLSNRSSFSARWTGQVRPQVSGDHVFKVRGDGGFRLYVNGQKLIDNFAAPMRPPVGYGPTVPLFATISLETGQVYPVVIEYRRMGGCFSYFEQGGLTGVQAGWASLQAPATLAGYSAVVLHHLPESRQPASCLDCLPGRFVRRLPRLRKERHGPALSLRLWALLHNVRFFRPESRTCGVRRPHAGIGDVQGEEHRPASGPRSRPGVRGPATPFDGPADQGTERV